MQEKIEQELANEFQEKYLELCKEYGLHHVAEPTLKRSNDTGIFGFVIEMKIGKFTQ